MIQAGFVFPISSKRKMLESILALPEPLYPTLMRVGEDEPGISLTDDLLTLDNLEARQSGFFLDNRKCSYDLNISQNSSIRLNCFLDVPTSHIRTLMVRLAESGPLFGYACLPEEREAKNRVKNQIGINSVESWVGRVIDRYLPGLYWWTCVSLSLVETHGIPLVALSNVALEHIAISDALHLFRFYEAPDGWRHATDIRHLTETVPGIFDVETIREPMAQAKTVLELFAISRQWK